MDRNRIAGELLRIAKSLVSVRPLAPSDRTSDFNADLREMAQAKMSLTGRFQNGMRLKEDVESECYKKRRVMREVLEDIEKLIPVFKAEVGKSSKYGDGASEHKRYVGEAITLLESLKDKAGKSVESLSKDILYFEQRARR